MTKPSLTFQLSLLGFLCLWFPSHSCAQVQVPRRTATTKGASQAEMQASRSTRLSARASDNANDTGSQQKIQFSFAQEEWKEVITWFADQAGFSLQPVDEWPEGTFDLEDKSDYTVMEALDQLNHALRLRNPPYTLVRNRNLLVLVEADQANYPPELIETVPVEKLDQRGKYETMRCVFEFGELDCLDYETQLKQLVSEENKSAFAVFPGANQIHVRETGAKLRVMRDLIATARQRQSAADSSLKVYRLKHTDADSFLFVARGLLGFEGENNFREDGTLAISAEPLSDRMFVKGTTTGLKQFDEVAALLDVPPDPVDSDGPLDQPFLRSYPVTSDPKLAFDALQTFLDGRDGVQMQQDETTGAILVYGRKADQKIVAETLATIEGSNGQQFAIVPLQYADPSTVIATLQRLWGQTSLGLGETPSGPVMLANSLDRTIIVKGAPSEVTAVKDQIAQLDGAATRVGDGPRTSTRVIPIENDAKRDQLLNILPDFWPSTGRANTLRFNQVLPEDRPMLRDRLRRVPDQGEPAGSGTKNDGGVRPEDPPFDVNLNRARQRAPWQGTSVLPAPSFSTGQSIVHSFDSLWRSAIKKSARFVTRSSALLTCWVGSRCQLVGYPVAMIVAPRQISSFSSQGTGSQSADVPVNPDYRPPEQPETVPGDDIRVKATAGGIVITSGDLDALDDLEDLIRSQLGSQSEVQKPQFFYLKHRYADDMVAFLSNYFGLSSGGDDGGGGGGLFGGVLDNVMGGGSGDMLDSILGGADGLGGSSTILEGDVRLGTDSEFNSMYVTGATEMDLLLINDLIEILDQPEAPHDPELLGSFRTIQIVHRDAEEVKEIVEVQLSDLIVPSGAAEGGNNNQQQVGQQAQMARLLATVAGGGGGGGNGGGGGGGAVSEPPRARLTVDTKTSQLLVTGPRFIYNEVLRVVMELDKPQLSEPPTLVVIPGGGNSDFIKRNLRALFGDKIEISDESEEDGSSSSSSDDDDRNESSSASQQAQRRTQQQQQQRQLERALNQRNRQNGGGNGGGRGGGNDGGGRGGNVGGGNRGGGGGGNGGGGGRGR